MGYLPHVFSAVAIYREAAPNPVSVTETLHFWMRDLQSGRIKKDFAQKSPALSSNSVQPVELNCPYYFSPLCHPQTLLAMILYVLPKDWGKTKGIEQGEIPGGPLWDTLLLQDDFSFTITIGDLSVSQF